MEETKIKKYRASFFSNIYYWMVLTVKWITGGKKDNKYYAMERAANILYPDFHFTEYGQVWRDDEKFEEQYYKLAGNNFHSIDRKYTVDQFLRLTKNLTGDTVECGAYLGATSYFICAFIQKNSQDKQHHIFDSFEGLSAPGKEDGSYWAKGDLNGTEEICRQHLSAFDFVHYYKGWIPGRFEEVKALQFSFVHIDVDLYQPTLDSIQFFYERMTKGAVMLCDDYGFASCPGAKKAMDDFFKNKPEMVIMLTTGQAFIIKE